MPSSYSPPLSPSYLYPTVCDLSEVEYPTTASATGSLSTSSSAEQKHFCCPYTGKTINSIEFSFADLGKDFHDLLGQPMLGDDTLLKETKESRITKTPSKRAYQSEPTEVEHPPNPQNEVLTALPSSHTTNRERLQDRRCVPDDHSYSFTDPTCQCDVQKSFRRSWRNLWRGCKPDDTNRYHHDDDSNMRFDDLYHLNRQVRCADKIVEYSTWMEADDFLFSSFQISTGQDFVLWECVELSTHQRFLVKIFTWNNESELARINEELDILSNIAVNMEVLGDRFARLEQIFWARDTLYAVMVSPGEDIRTLQSVVLRHGYLKEEHVCRIVGPLLNDLLKLQEHLDVHHWCLLPKDILICRDYTPCIMGFSTATKSRQSFVQSRREYGNDMISAVLDEPGLGQCPTVPVFDIQRDGNNEDGGHSPDSVMLSIGTLVSQCLYGTTDTDSCGFSPRIVGGNRNQTSRCMRYDHHQSDSALMLGPKREVQPELCRHRRSASCSRIVSSLSNRDTFNDFHLPRSPVSRSAKQFISSCLHEDPIIRMTVPEALEHPWVVANSKKESHSKRLIQGKTSFRKRFRWWPCRGLFRSTRKNSA